MLFLNNTDLLGADWRFIEPYWSRPSDDWAFFHGVPKNGFERFIRRPNISRYRAAGLTVLAARNANQPAVIISHLPSMAAPTNFLRSRLCPQVPQIAFSFNFTTLPQGGRRKLLSTLFRGINEFVVFSTLEKQLYVDHFELDPTRIRFVPWAMETPEYDPIPPISTNSDYVCAIGGEGRDYALFAQAMEMLPYLRGVVVARPYSISGISFPKNVKIFTNLPLKQTWAIAKHSLGLVVPLKTDITACGHITIVGAQRLGVPLLVTKSHAVTDYVSEETARLVTAGSLSELISGLQELIDDRREVSLRCDKAQMQASQLNHPSVWVDYLEEACDRIVC